MLLRTENFHSVLVVALPADVDTANAKRVGEELVARATHSVSSLIVDLSETRYLDSAGVNMLFRLHARMRHRRKELRVVLPSTSSLRRVLEIVSADTAELPVHASIQEAIEAGMARSRDIPS